MMDKERIERPLNGVTKEMVNSWVSPNDIDFIDPEAERAYRDRATRIRDAIQLKIPDRVPFWFQDHCYFPCRYVGITFEEAVHNPEKWSEANKKTFLDFQPDMFFNPGFSVRTSGQTQAALDTKNMKWPGHGIPKDASHQYVEGEYMKADEYDAFIDDLSDFTVRTWLPRVYGALAPFKTLPPLHGLGLGLPGMSDTLISPDLINAFKSIYRAGLEAAKWNEAASSMVKDLRCHGFPMLIGGGGIIPFDYISDFFRGMHGTMMDMYRQPDKLIAAMDMLMPKITAMAMAGPKRTGNPGVFIALHRGSDTFMSSQHFETFYWPYLKKLMLILIDEGLTPCPFLEGDFTSRLEYFSELPKGKVLGFFDGTDIYKAKEILGDTMCISGMMPVSLIQVGTPEKVKKYTRKLIDTVGKDGGFIMAPRSVMDNANPELVKVWADFTKEYGVYKE